MRSFPRAGVPLVLACCLALSTAASASATTVNPIGAGFTLATGAVGFTAGGGLTYGCTGSTIAGTVPAVGNPAPTVTMPVTLAFTGCTGPWGPGTITCTGITMSLTFNPTPPPDAFSTLTIPPGACVESWSNGCVRTWPTAKLAIPDTWLNGPPATDTLGPVGGIGYTVNNPGPCLGGAGTQTWSGPGGGAITYTQSAGPAVVVGP